MKYITIVLVALFALSGCGFPTADNGLLFRTADPNLSIGFRLLPPPPGAPLPPAIAPDPVAIAIEEEEAAQVACDIKVNVSQNDIVFHLPGMAYYARVKVDFSQGDFWACDEAEAIAAGARKSSR